MDGVNLQYAKAKKAFLASADLSNANMREMNLNRADLRGASLISADLRGANLKKAVLVGAQLDTACLQGAKLRKAKFSENRSNTEANIEGTDFAYANLQGAKFRGLLLEHVSFRGADLREADLTDADLHFVNFENAILVDVEGEPREHGGHIEAEPFHGDNVERGPQKNGYALTWGNEETRWPKHRKGHTSKRIMFKNAFKTMQSDHVRWVEKESGGHRLYLSYVDFSGMNFSDIGLHNLEGIPMQGTDLRGADLTGVAWGTDPDPDDFRDALCNCDTDGLPPELVCTTVRDGNCPDKKEEIKTLSCHQKDGIGRVVKKDG